ncbi:MAG: hypothetical protein IPK78_03355 [Rhodospirillales bacterium]|nr:hypothetical protein [Rhodospirillales bacterium]
MSSRVADEGTNFVFDNGAGSHQPMMTYLLEAGLFGGSPRRESASSSTFPSSARKLYRTW